MPTFYKGIGPGTHWHAIDLRTNGLSARAPGVQPSISALIAHIRLGTTQSPYISLTRSYGVAESYARVGRITATQQNPGYVYELVINDPLPSGMVLIDPAVDIANTNANLFASPSYHHDGGPTFLLGVVDPVSMAAHLNGFAPSPPGSGAIQRPPNLSNDLEAIVRVLRDAEILVSGNIPTTCFHVRHPVY
jgi:hypothetical protein